MKRFIAVIALCFCAFCCFGQESSDSFESISTFNGETYKGEECTVMLYSDDAGYHVSLYSRTPYDDFVEIYFVSESLDSAALVYHRVINLVRLECMPAFTVIITECPLFDLDYSVDIYKIDSGATGLYYHVNYNSFLDFFRD